MAAFTMEQIKSMKIIGNAYSDMGLINACDGLIRDTTQPMEVRIEALEYLSTNVMDLGCDPTTEEDIEMYMEESGL